jgi:uncharacterized protein YkwD
MKKMILAVLIVIEIEVLLLFLIQEKKNIKTSLINTRQTPILTLTPTKEIKVEPTTISKPTLPSLENGGLKKTTPTPDTEPWGVAKQIDDVTWTMKIGEDATMATAKEIFEALNEYRKVQGSQVLNWDEKLSNYAQERAKYLNIIKSVDQHKGFNDFVKNQDGFNKLGFTALGENISYGFKLNGVHIIEWMYAGDKPHNDNQLDNRWNYVGIGVDGLATCLILGTGKF